VGHTASTLLEVDEAQDVSPAKFDKDLAPMAASTNATTVLWGTVWTTQTLLAREKNAALAEEKKDGLRRVFMYDATVVGAEVPSYAKFVGKQIAKLGRQHPLVKTQFFLEALDEQGGMFPEWRQLLMQGDHPPRTNPEPGANGSSRIYCALLDIAGEDRGASDTLAAANAIPSPSPAGELANPDRDATTLTIVEVDTTTLADLEAPTYRVVLRHAWVGSRHTLIYAQLRTLLEQWHITFLVADATGLGAGLVSFLDRSFPGRVIPYVFTPKSKSALGYGFLAVCDTGRFRDYASDETAEGTTGERTSANQLGFEFKRQLGAVRYEILKGPAKTMRWSVPDGTRDPATGTLLHDDLVISAALCSVLDSQSFPTGQGVTVIPAMDPLAAMDGARF
jgi:hypothetical protein